ncbi:MAG: hypothetical protein IIC84_07685 [Chloroflexi bacterium]|nr:hypothetical protein [Chloroflexota bacterium]
MTQHADIEVYTPQSGIQLVVEVKTKRGETDEWAAKFRRNLFAHQSIPSSRFFLIALPEHLYLWRDKTSPDLIPADYKVRTKDVLRPYLEQISLEELDGLSFEFLVKAWLDDLIWSKLTREEAGPGLEWVFDSGLYESIRHGEIRTEAAV